MLDWRGPSDESHRTQLGLLAEDENLNFVDFWIKKYRKGSEVKKVGVLTILIGAWKVIPVTELMLIEREVAHTWHKSVGWETDPTLYASQPRH